MPAEYRVAYSRSRQSSGSPPRITHLDMPTVEAAEEFIRQQKASDAAGVANPMLIDPYIEVRAVTPWRKHA